MASEAGQAFSIKIGANALGAERTGTLTLNRELIDQTTKDSNNDAEFAYGKLSGQMDFDGLYAFSDTAQDALEAGIAAGTGVTADFTSGTTGERHISFPAFGSAFQRTDPNEDNSTLTGSMMSSGAITYEDVS